MTERNPISPSIVAPLINWYRATRRSLPWREGRNPYRIWISEIMLQQTRIETVIPYYTRFLAEVPSPAELAVLDDERLMKLWEGLGYYSRARNLKAAAREMVEKHGGNLPDNYASLRSLKGIGDYTAGAIASIAFGLPEPAVDGNVLRVIMRLCGREDDIAQAATKKAVTEWLRNIYPHGEDASDMTEGLMELGERICIPTGAPKCTECPLASQCVAARDDLWRSLPKKSPKKEKKAEEYTVLLMACQGRVAIHKRPKNGLLADLWEFPNLSGTRSPEEVAAFLAEQQVSPEKIQVIDSASHVFTHITWKMSGYWIDCPEIFGKDYLWVTAEQLQNEYALPGAFRTYLQIFFRQTE